MEQDRSKLKTFIQTELAADRPDVDLENESLVESGIIDSLGIMKLVEFLEGNFAVKIDDQDLLPDHFETLDAILQLVADKRG